MMNRMTMLLRVVGVSVALLTGARTDRLAARPATTTIAPDSVEPPQLLNTAVSSTPSPGKTIAVAAGGNLQAALDAAQPGDRITLACGAVYSGNMILKPKSGTGWITVASATDCATAPEGTRAAPTQKFARIASPNVLPAIGTNGAASRWRFIGVEVTVLPGVATNRALVALGCAKDCERDTVSQPRDIIFDRSYIHGTPSLDVRRCIALNGARMAIIDSYVSDCHSTFDAQAIAGWNGPGPFKITNNYLEGAAENIAFGGADPVTGTNLVPSDIEIRHNHITKPMKWKGGPWLIKNLIELKVGRRVIIEANVLENSWSAAQDFAIVMWSVNQQTTCTWCEVGHVLIQNNVIRNTAGGFSLNATGSNDLPQYKAVPMNHVTIRNTVVIGLDNAAIGGNGRLFQINNPIQNLTIEHNTGFSPSNSSFLWGGTLPLPNHIVRNNLVGGGQYQLFTVYGQGQAGWSKVAGPGSVFAGNVIAKFSGGTMIPGNYGADSFDWIGLAGGSAAAYSVTAAITDLGILPSSGYAKKGTDGKNPGADVAAVKAATAKVVVP